MLVWKVITGADIQGVRQTLHFKQAFSTSTKVTSLPLTDLKL